MISRSNSHSNWITSTWFYFRRIRDCPSCNTDHLQMRQWQHRTVRDLDHLTIERDSPLLKCVNEFIFTLPTIFDIGIVFLFVVPLTFITAVSPKYSPPLVQNRWIRSFFCMGFWHTACNTTTLFLLRQHNTHRESYNLVFFA